jgi:cyclic pyranopterin phosphate synthase
MFDSFNRRINYLRISVTDRCNLRCEYCMPAEGIQLIPRKRILKFAEIAEITRAAVGMGVTKVRITGGEPLVRRRVVELVEMIANIQGVEDFGMTTNAIALRSFAQPLRDAGLHRSASAPAAANWPTPSPVLMLPSPQSSIRSN